MKILFFANTDWYLFNFRLALAHFLRQQGHDVVLLSPPGPFIARIEAHGFRTHTVPMIRRSLSPLREIGLVNRIRQVYAAEKPDLVHHFTIKCVVYGEFAALLAKVPYTISAITGLGYVFTSQKLKDRLLRVPVRFLLRLALNISQSRLIVQNPDDAKNALQAKLIGKERIRLIRGSGVDTAKFQPAVRLASATDDLPTTILMATRLLWEKGVREYVNAARQLRKEGIAAQFLLAGAPDAGNPSAIPPEQLFLWKKEGIVTMLGHVDNMPLLWNQVDIAVLPSRYGEGVPRSLLEAASCGLPIVATCVPGCREIVENGINGLFVMGRSGDNRLTTLPTRSDGDLTLTEALRLLCLQPETRRSMGQASRKKVLAEFDERIVFEKTLAVYRERGGFS